jgi:hypothetical protein
MPSPISQSVLRSFKTVQTRQNRPVYKNPGTVTLSPAANGH